MRLPCVPTRLLDVTTNPLTALYFACANKFGQPKEGEGVVYIFKTCRKKVKTFDSDTVAILASLPRFKKEAKNEIRRRAENANKRPVEGDRTALEAFNADKNDNEDERYVAKLLHEIKKERPAFEHIICPEDLLSNFFCIPRKNNVRIIRQDGAFIVFGLTEAVPMPPIEKIFVKNDEKGAIFNELKSLGITQPTLFPELYQVAEYVKRKYKRAPN
jgi:hypothetical protein